MAHEIVVKSILNKTKRRDPWFLDDYTINPYSACSFNCLYCYIRGSKYGEHMEEKLSVKINALEVLDKQLKDRAKKGQYGIIVLASATDPYLQIENEYQLTRNILALILQYKFPVHILTKSDLVVRDFDLLKKINDAAILPGDLQANLRDKVFITFSFSTLDDATGKIFEPGALSPTKRLHALMTTRAAGFYSGVILMPLRPLISDTDEHLNIMFKAFRLADASYVFPASLTLFGNQSSDSKPLVLRAIQKHFPQLLGQYEKLFSFGYQVPSWYRNDLNKRTTALSEYYNLRNRIF